MLLMFQMLIFYSDGYWVHENTGVTVNQGDTVYYWVYVLVNGLGYQITDMSWIAGSMKVVFRVFRYVNL